MLPEHLRRTRRTLVKHDATIGANATIICGTTIGRYAFVAAGAVVKDDVPDNALVVGVPARQIGWVCRCGLRLRDLDTRHPAKCPQCGRQYELAEDKLKPLD